MIFRNIICLSLPFACAAWTVPWHSQDVLNEINIAVDCWVGEIHSPCNGSETGCTPDGILVSHCYFVFDGLDTLHTAPECDSSIVKQNISVNNLRYR